MKVILIAQGLVSPIHKFALVTSASLLASSVSGSGVTSRVASLVVESSPTATLRVASFFAAASLFTTALGTAASSRVGPLSVPPC